MSDMEREFQRVMRRDLALPLRELLNAATEVHVKHGLRRGAEATRRKKEIREGVEFERLRAALMDCERAGYVADEWHLEDAG